MEFIRRYVPYHGIVFDVGAHVGLINQQVAALRPDVTTHAFEPHPVRFEALRYNVKLNGTSVVTNRVGLSSNRGSLAYDGRSHAVTTGGADVIVVVTPMPTSTSMRSIA